MEKQKLVIVPSEMYGVVFKDGYASLCQPGKHIVRLYVKKIHDEIYLLRQVETENSNGPKYYSFEESVITGSALEEVCFTLGL